MAAVVGDLGGHDAGIHDAFLVVMEPGDDEHERGDDARDTDDRERLAPTALQPFVGSAAGQGMLGSEPGASGRERGDDGEADDRRREPPEPAGDVRRLEIAHRQDEQSESDDGDEQRAYESYEEVLENRAAACHR